MHPIYHLAPEKNWCNDPVGFIYYNDLYHLFYQYFPYGCTWGTMHWYHAVSKDLIHWENLGIALYPSKDYDANGCFSGSSLNIDGKMYLYYTSIKYLQPDPNNIHKTINDAFIASQSLVISDNGFDFDNINNKQLIIPAFQEGELGDPTHTRDPKVWKYQDMYYMVIVSQYRDANKHKQGQLLFYTSKDGVDWSYTNHYRGITIGDMWECPDIFSVNNQQLLIMSPERTENHGYPSHARIATCHFNHLDCSMEITSDLRFLDYGRDLYAPQSTIDKDGRRIFVGWMRMPEAVDETWRGLFTYPRLIEYHDHHIYTPIYPDIHQLFQQVSSTFDHQIPCMIQTHLDNNDYISIGGYHISFQDRHLIANRQETFVDCDDVDMICQSPEIDSCDLEIYLDHHIIEIYINHGYSVLSHVIYHLTDDIDASVPYTIYHTKEKQHQN